MYNLFEEYSMINITTDIIINMADIVNNDNSNFILFKYPMIIKKYLFLYSYI